MLDQTQNSMSYSRLQEMYQIFSRKDTLTSCRIPGFLDILAKDVHTMPITTSAMNPQLVISHTNTPTFM